MLPLGHLFAAVLLCFVFAMTLSGALYCVFQPVM